MSLGRGTGANPSRITAAWYDTTLTDQSNNHHPSAHSHVLSQRRGLAAAASAPVIITVAFDSPLYILPVTAAAATEGAALPRPILPASGDVAAAREWARTVSAAAQGSVLRCGRAIYTALTPLLPAVPELSAGEGEGEFAAEDWALFESNLKTLSFTLLSSNSNSNSDNGDVSALPKRLSKCRLALPASNVLTDANGAPLLPAAADSAGGAVWAAPSPRLRHSNSGGAPHMHRTGKGSGDESAAHGHVRRRGYDREDDRARHVLRTSSPSDYADSAATQQDQSAADAAAEFAEDSLLAPVLLELSSLITDTARTLTKQQQQQQSLNNNNTNADDTVSAGQNTETESVFLEASLHVAPQESSFVREARARVKAAAATANKLNAVRYSRTPGAAADASGGTGIELAPGGVVTGQTLLTDAVVLLQTGHRAGATVHTRASAAAALQARHAVRQAQRMATESAAFLRLANQLESAVRAGAVVSHGVVWQVIIRPLMVMARDYIRKSTQEIMYQVVKASALPGVTCLICQGKAAIPEGTSPDLPKVADLIDPEDVQATAADESHVTPTPEEAAAAKEKEEEEESFVEMGNAQDLDPAFLQYHAKITTAASAKNSNLSAKGNITAVDAEDEAAIDALFAASSFLEIDLVTQQVKPHRRSSAESQLGSSLSAADLDAALAEIEQSERAQRLIAAVRAGHAAAEPELKGLVASQLALYEERVGLPVTDRSVSTHGTSSAMHNSARTGNLSAQRESASGHGAAQARSVLFGAAANAFDHLPARVAAAKRKQQRAAAAAGAAAVGLSELDAFIVSDTADLADSNDALRSRQLAGPAAAVAASAASLIDRAAQAEHFEQQQAALQAGYSRATGTREFPSLAEMDSEHTPEARKPGNLTKQVAAGSGDDETSSFALEIVKWIVDPLVANLEPAIVGAVQEASIQSIQFDVEDKLKRTLNATLVREVTRTTVTMVTHRLSYAFTHRISRGLIHRLIPEVVALTTGPLFSALSHSLAMTLTRALTRNPKHDEDCYFCSPTELATRPWIVEAGDKTKHCNVCKAAMWNEYYLDYYTSYYTQYFYGYYGYYYGEYFSRVFAEEQVMILEEAQILSIVRQDKKDAEAAAAAAQGSNISVSSG